MKKTYSFLPLWMLLLIPGKWLHILPTCLIIDAAALWWALRSSRIARPAERWRRFYLPVVLVQLIGHGVVQLLMLLLFRISANATGGFGKFLGEFVNVKYAMVLPSLLRILVVAIAAAASYAVLHHLVFRRMRWVPWAKRSVAWKIALIIAPYFLLFPTPWI